MFGVLGRAAASALLFVVVAAIVGRVADPFLNAMTNGSANKSDMLYSGLQAASQPRNIALIGILGLIVTLIAAAIVEQRFGG